MQCHYQVDTTAIVVRVKSATLPPAVTSAEHVHLSLDERCGTTAMGCEYVLIRDDVSNDGLPTSWAETGPSLELRDLAEGAWALYLRPCRAPGGLGPCGNGLLHSNGSSTGSDNNVNENSVATVRAVPNIVRWIVDRRLPEVSFVRLPAGVSVANETAAAGSTASSTPETPVESPTFRRLLSTAATVNDDTSSGLNAAAEAGNVIVNSDSLNVEVAADKAGCRFFYWLTQNVLTSPSSAALSPVGAPSFSLEHVNGVAATTGKGTNGWVEWNQRKDISDSSSSSTSDVVGSTTTIMEVTAAPAGLVEQRILWIVAADPRGMAPSHPLNALSWFVDHRYPRTFLVAAPPQVAATADAAFYLDCALDASPNPLVSGDTTETGTATGTSTASGSESSVEKVFMERAGGGPQVSSVSETAPIATMVAGDGAQCAFQYALDESEDWVNAENPMVLFQVPEGVHTLRMRASRVAAPDTDEEDENGDESTDGDDGNEDERDDHDTTTAAETPEAVWDPNPPSFSWMVDLLPPKIDILTEPQSPLHEPLAAFSFLGNKPSGALELFVHLSYDPNPADVATVGGGSGGNSGGRSSSGSGGEATGNTEDLTSSDTSSDNSETSRSTSSGASSATATTQCGADTYPVNAWWRACSSDYATLFRRAADVSQSSLSSLTNETFGTWVALNLSDFGSDGLLEDATIDADATTASTLVSSTSSKSSTLSVALRGLVDGAYRARFGALDRRSGAIDENLLSGRPLEVAWAVDSTKPETFVLSAPRSPSAVGDASFLIDSTFPSATFDFCADTKFEDFDWNAFSSSSSSDLSGAGCAYNVSAEAVSVHELSGGGHNITVRHCNTI